MPQANRVLATAESDEGRLELLQRGDGAFLITLAGRVLMNSAQNRSEVILGELVAHRIATLAQPRMLIGGLGLGCTLRAALDILPKTADVAVAEINPVVVEWCRGPLNCLNDEAVRDPRVQVLEADVIDVIAGLREKPCDAIVLDLYEGPRTATQGANDRLYGTKAIRSAWNALRPGGTYAVWGEAPDVPYEKRLRSVGFEVERRRPGRGGLRHVVYFATRPDQRRSK